MSKNTIDTLTNLLEEVKVNLAQEVDYEINGGKISEISKYFDIRAGLFHRAYDLTSSAIIILDKSPIAGKLLARGVFETSAVLGYLYIQIKKFIETKNIEDFNDILLRLMLGTKFENAEHSSINVLTAITQVEKKFPELNGLMDYYSQLCEFSHPNFLGTCGTYGELTETKTIYRTIPTDMEKHKQETITALCFALIVKLYVLYTMKQLKTITTIKLFE
jgi:hypothetical protein